MALGTDRLLLIPINTKLTAINALVSVGLPLYIETPRTNHFDAVLRLPADQDWGGDISCIDQVLTGREGSPRKLGMDRFCHGLISRRGNGRGHMGDEVRRIFLACFGHVHGCHRSSASRAFCLSLLLDHREN